MGFPDWEKIRPPPVDPKDGKRFLYLPEEWGYPNRNTIGGSRLAGDCHCGSGAEPSPFMRAVADEQAGSAPAAEPLHGVIRKRKRELPGRIVRLGSHGYFVADM